MWCSMRLTLRDLFWFVLVLTLPLGWWIDHSHMATRQLQLESALTKVYERVLRGQPLATVEEMLELAKTPVSHTPNLPPGEDAEAVYLLDDGDLTLRFSGDPAIVTKAEFRPSNQPVRDRLDRMNGAWSDWVDAHSN
jgi:hypothetical protein